VNWKDWEGSGVSYFKVLYLPARPDRIHVTLFRVSHIKNVVKIKQDKETGKGPTHSNLTL
jgi:hypothetical protein